MRHQGRKADEILATIASASHGVVTRGQLLQAGLTAGELRQRLVAGALLREYPGVYRVGHRAPSLEARYLAAVCACGQGALLSGVAAGHLLSVTKGPAPSPEVLTLNERRIEGVCTRRTRRFDPRDRMIWRGVPVTTPARTIVDIAAVLGVAQLARACHEAGVRYSTSPAQVEAVLARRPSSAGAARLRTVLRGDVHVTLSTLERAFLALLRHQRLPLPETNRMVGSRRVDCHWRERRITIELDSYRYHGSRHAWEQDRRREREARARGDEFRRYTYGDVMEDPKLMLAELRELLSGSHPALVS